MLSFTQFITEEVSTGININDKTQPFTDQILHGQKTIETRNTPTLHPHVGKRVGIVRTGKGPAQVVGHATIGKPIFYKNEEDFRKDYDKHQVAPQSKFDIGPNGKWGYPLLNVERVKPYPPKGRGIVSRKI